MDIKCSIVISVLESYDVVARQIKHFNKILPDDWELILMDDGSEPSIGSELWNGYRYIIELIQSRDNIHLFETNKSRILWHQPAAKNLAVQKASGEYILGTDIDHIITAEAIESVNQNIPFHKMYFPRTWGILDESGNIDTNLEILKFYGLSDENIGKVSSHANTFAMKRETFLSLGGYDEKFCGRYGGDDTDFNNRYGELAHQNGWKTIKGGMIYVYPNPRADCCKIFHSLRRRAIKKTT